MEILDAIAQWKRRADREEHPDGEFDNAKRWYPKGEERQECCRDIRNPTREWPNSLLNHCRSLEHVALLNGVDPGLARMFAMIQKKWPAEIIQKVEEAVLTVLRLSGGNSIPPLLARKLAAKTIRQQKEMTNGS